MADRIVSPASTPTFRTVAPYRETPEARAERLQALLTDVSALLLVTARALESRDPALADEVIALRLADRQLGTVRDALDGAEVSGSLPEAA